METEPVGLGHIFQPVKLKTMNQLAPEGFANWRNLYDHLKVVGMENEQRVALTYPQENPHPDTVSETHSNPEVRITDREIVLYVDEIKARAFEEIYDLLPEKGSVVMLQEMLETGSKLPGVNKHVRPAIEFLKKIPTRS